MVTEWFHVNHLVFTPVPDTAGVPVKDWRRPRASEDERQHLHRQSSHRISLCRKGRQRPGDALTADVVGPLKSSARCRLIEMNHPQGANVRDKAKVVLVLMEDDEKLKEERAFAVKTREKTSKSSGGQSLCPSDAITVSFDVYQFL